MAKELNVNNFDSEIASGTTLVDFWAAWCGPCRAQGSILAKFEQEQDTNITIAKVNVDQEQSLAERFQISTIPTLILFQNGKPQKRVSGVQSIDSLKTLTK